MNGRVWSAKGGQDSWLGSQAVGPLGVVFRRSVFGQQVMSLGVFAVFAHNFEGKAAFAIATTGRPITRDRMEHADRSDAKGIDLGQRR